MKVTSIFKVYPVLVLTLLLGCSDDDAKKNGAYSFKDQDLSGEIEGYSWTYADGLVNESTFDDEEVLDITLTLGQAGSICESFPEGDRVIFFVPNTVGLYKLSFDLTSFDGQVVTLFDDEQTLNTIATKGAIEIISISETTVTGRIDARADGDNYVNGNFAVSFCPTE